MSFCPTAISKNMHTDGFGAQLYTRHVMGSFHYIVTTVEPVYKGHPWDQVVEPVYIGHPWDQVQWNLYIKDTLGTKYSETCV